MGAYGVDVQGVEIINMKILPTQWGLVPGSTAKAKLFTCVSHFIHIRTFNVIAVIWAPIGDMKKLKRLNVPEVTQLIAEVRFESYDIQEATQVDSAIGVIRWLGRKQWKIFQFYQM